VKNAEKIVAALIALHKALGESWSTEIRNHYGRDNVEIAFQAQTEAAHRKLAGFFGLTPSWTLRVAICIGRYDANEGDPDEAGCDECCGHGCEDGYCEQLYDDDGEPTDEGRTRAAGYLNARRPS
jgi:hypothetical protein